MREQRIWQINKNELNVVETLMSNLHVSRVMACVLANRGILTPEQAIEFLHAGMNDLRDPLEIPGMCEGAARIRQAIDHGENILVYGDYDVDGITATALLTGVLRQLGGKVDYYIPARLEEGYGLNNWAILHSRDQGAELIVTVDCGISSVEEIAYAAQLGLDVVITDHHQLPSQLPAAKAVISPRLADKAAPWAELAGVGVAFKLAQAVATLFKRSRLCEDYLDLVALGTIADIVPLLGENRILVREGLPWIGGSGRPGLEALAEVGGLKGRTLSSEQVAFLLAPRLNACGRLGRAELGVELLLTADPMYAREAALALDRENRARQALEAAIINEAMQQIKEEEDLLTAKILVLASPNWHSGVIGIAASKLVDKYHRPTVMIALENGIGRGSARSIPGFNLHAALFQVRDCLLNFGGHEQAAGFSLHEEMIPVIKEKLKSYASGLLQEKHLTPVLKVDTEVGRQEITEDLVKELDLLAPFGYHNPYPLLAVRGQQLAECRGVGAGSAHLKIKVASGNVRLDGIAFQKGSLREAVAAWDRCDLAFTPEINIYQGRARVQLNVRDLKPHLELDDPFTPPPYLDRLYLEGQVWLEDNFYRDVVNREEFYTKVVGVTFEHRQEAVELLTDGDTLELKPEPDNGHDPHAVGVYSKGGKIGYLNSRLARCLAPALEKGTAYEVCVSKISGRDKEKLGVNIYIRRIDHPAESGKPEQTRKRLNSLPEAEITEEIRQAVLGTYSYREKQQEALRHLQSGRNALVIFATGRGKSAVFQTMAAYLAVVKKEAALIIYPLRSLVNEQYQRLRQKLSPLGISVAAVNGSVNMEEKKEFFQRLGQGQVDVVLTTPEFLDYHIDKFKSPVKKWGLFVVDEAHHLALAKRRGYRLLAKNRNLLGKPLSLAVTATAGDETARRIVDLLECEYVVVEEHTRHNLQLVDRREEKDKLAYLVNLAARGGRVVIYVNSRKQAYQLASDLRLYYPPAKDEIAFYHGGLPSADRTTLENMFREGALRVMVTTSAFGEGIDIPDIKHVVLYHLCFSKTEFNQLAGRAGRNNKAACVHIIFGEKDKKLNEMILEAAAPSRETLGQVYLYLRERSRETNPMFVTNREISEAVERAGLKNFREHTASACLAILEDIGLIKREMKEGRRYLLMAPAPPGKLELHDSVRYLEGLDEREEFQEFAGMVLTSSAAAILETINRPICPQKCQEQEIRTSL